MSKTQEPENLVLVAVIVAPHGVNGAVSAESHSDNPRRFAVGQQLRTASGSVLCITSASPHKGRLLLTFAGVDNRDQAEKLRGVKLYIDPAQSVPLPEGQWYWFQLLDLEVWQGDRLIGRISDVLPYTANDVYVVQTGQGQLLLPALRSIVQKVDLAAGRMEVLLPPGLEEINQPTPN